jgi:hypothetical protein
MILKGSQRSGGAALAAHLLNDRDNDHVEVLEIDGFAAEDLHGAFLEAHAVSKGTQCKQYLFSLSLSPPQDAVLSDEDFLKAVEQAGQTLGLDEQPRAVVIHEKEGRRHAHAVWSRIDAESMTAINLPHFKNKLRDLSRDLYLDHGWELPNGLATYGNKNPLNFTLEEWQKAKRQGVDPREIKQAFQTAWATSDNLNSFGNALENKGLFLARGSRRGFVALDLDGNVYSISKWAGIKAKDVTSKLGKPDALPSVAETRADIRSKVSGKVKGFISQVKSQHRDEALPLLAEKTKLVSEHRTDREKLRDEQNERWTKETQIRSQRLNKGIRGLFDRISGKARETRQHNEAEAMASLRRDRNEKQTLLRNQMHERQALQSKLMKLRDKQKQERAILARDVTSVMRMKTRTESTAQDIEKTRKQRSRGFDYGIS